MKIIITGPGATGKDFLKDRLVNNLGYNYGISYTTRPKRKNEEHSVDYLFTSKDAFIAMIKHNQFINWQVYNNWYYGLSFYSFDKCNLFILTPDSINNLALYVRKKCKIIYIDTPESIRKTRLEERNDVDSVERRLKADFEMFNGFTDYDLKISDSNINLSKIQE